MAASETPPYPGDAFATKVREALADAEKRALETIRLFRETVPAHNAYERKPITTAANKPNGSKSTCRRCGCDYDDYTQNCIACKNRHSSRRRASNSNRSG